MVVIYGFISTLLFFGYIVVTILDIKLIRLATFILEGMYGLYCKTFTHIDFKANYVNCYWAIACTANFHTTVKVFPKKVFVKVSTHV